MLAAIAIFAAAAAVAVVQATNSDDATETQPVDETVVTPTEQETTQEASSSSEPNGTEVAQPSAPTEEQQQALGQEQIAEVEAVEEAAEDQEDQQQSVDQVQSPATEEMDHPLRGFRIPIAGACITEFAGHLPGSPRTYRNDGVHEGLDFYEWASCTRVDYATEILAAKAGVVIRADIDYVEVTPADWQRFIDANWEGEDILDELRGRQIYIDHGRGIVTRYAHLSAIADGIAAGVEVEQGQLIGYPGESGQQEVYANPGTDIHLHFEIRVGDGWLGQGETQEEARKLYLQAFGLVD